MFQVWSQSFAYQPGILAVLQLRKTLRVHVFECVGQDLLLSR